MRARVPTGLLRVFAFVAPIYFIFYPPLHDLPRTNQLWRATLAGFCFCAVAGTLLLLLR